MSERPRREYVTAPVAGPVSCEVIVDGRRVRVSDEVLGWSGMKLEYQMGVGEIYAVNPYDGRRVKLDQLADQARAPSAIPDPLAAAERDRVLRLIDELMLNNYSHLSEAERARFEQLQLRIISGKHSIHD